jgi:hypothetical protein
MSERIDAMIRGFAERPDDQGIVALAEELAGPARRAEAEGAVAAAIAGLADRDKRIQSGCVKLLYEIGYREPALIAERVEVFLRLVKSKNNRLAWGGMIALSTIAALRPAPIFEKRAQLLELVRSGSVITQDRGMMTLGLVAAASLEYRAELFPKLLAILRGARPGDVPKFGEQLLPAVDAGNATDYRAALESRLGELAPAAAARTERLVKKAAKLQGKAARAR